MRNMLNEVPCVYVINRVHYALGCIYVYFDHIMFVLCASGSR